MLTSAQMNAMKNYSQVIHILGLLMKYFQSWVYGCSFFHCVRQERSLVRLETERSRKSEVGDWWMDLEVRAGDSSKI